MEIIAGLFTTLWDGLTNEITIPIINCSGATFLLTLLILNIVFGFLNFFLGKHGDSKGE